tara:strand:+ start:134 stop:436 length:303 start_codon:yes stop_codon:yes gene_type:complete
MSQDTEKLNPADQNELESLRRKLKFRSWHRGTREMDMILGRFADRHIGDFNADQLKQFEMLLGYSDPDLYNWLSKAEPLPANLDSEVMQLFLSFETVKEL